MGEVYAAYHPDLVPPYRTGARTNNRGESGVGKGTRGRRQSVRPRPSSVARRARWPRSARARGAATRMGSEPTSGAGDSRPTTAIIRRPRSSHPIHASR
jgi:hypothetical protein